MTMTHSHTGGRKKLDVASVALLLVGLACGVLAYWLVAERDANPLVLAPAIVSATIGATHLYKREAPHLD